MKERNTTKVQRSAISRWEGEGGARRRSGGIVDAPGKTHRKSAPSERGVKHSDQAISKITGAKTMRRGHRRG